MTLKAPQINANQSQEGFPPPLLSRVQLFTVTRRWAGKFSRMTLRKGNKTRSIKCLASFETRWTSFGNHCQTYEVSPRSVRWSPAVRPSAPCHPSPSRLRSNCDPNGNENTDSPFANPSWVLNLAGGWVKRREHRLPLCDRMRSGGRFFRTSLSSLTSLTRCSPRLDQTLNDFLCGT